MRAVVIVGCLLVSVRAVAANVVVDETTCTFANAITTALSGTPTNGCTGDDSTIVFAPGVSSVTLADTIALSGDLTILGGSTKVTINVADDFVTATSGQLTLHDLIIQAAVPTNGDIYSTGTVSLERCDFRGVGAPLNVNLGSSLVVVDTTFAGMTAAIGLAATTTLQHVTVDGVTGTALSGVAVDLDATDIAVRNVAHDCTALSIGGASQATIAGLHVENCEPFYISGGAVTIGADGTRRSTFSDGPLATHFGESLTIRDSDFLRMRGGFTAEGDVLLERVQFLDGIGAFVRVDGVTLAGVDVTFAGNSISFPVTAVLQGDDSAIVLTNATFYHNVSDAPVVGTLVAAGAVTNDDGDFTCDSCTFADNTGATASAIAQTSVGTTTLTNTIISGGNAPAISGTLVSAGYNLFTATVPGALTTDLTVVDARLGAFGDHGGPVQTLVPTGSSAAVNGGNPAATSAHDARGVVRTEGGRRDIGATELRFGVSAAPIVATVVEGAVATCAFAFTSPIDVEVGVAVADVTASAADHGSAATTVESDLAVSVTVQTTQDTTAENAETFTVTLGGALCTVTISDDDTDGNPGGPDDPDGTGETDDPSGAGGATNNDGGCMATSASLWAALACALVARRFRRPQARACA